VQELVDAHRGGQPDANEIRALTFAVPERDYDLLLGLRRHRDWSAIRPRAFDASLTSLRQTYDFVISDVDPDLEGEDQCGSLDVEERNHMSRAAVRNADAVVLVGLPAAQSIHRLARLASLVVELGVAPSKVLPAINRAPRNPRARAEITRAFADLSGRGPAGGGFGPVLHLGARRQAVDLGRDTPRLPTHMASTLSAAVAALIDRSRGTAPREAADEASPAPITPGSLGLALDADVMP
jgi:hypothetical protein